MIDTGRTLSDEVMEIYHEHPVDRMDLDGFDVYRPKESGGYPVVVIPGDIQNSQKWMEDHKVWINENITKYGAE